MRKYYLIYEENLAEPIAEIINGNAVAALNWFRQVKREKLPRFYAVDFNRIKTNVWTMVVTDVETGKEHVFIALPDERRKVYV